MGRVARTEAVILQTVVRCPRSRAAALWCYRMLLPLGDLRQVVRAPFAYCRFLAQWRRYGRVAESDRPRIRDWDPQLRDRTRRTGVDTHYFHTNGWGMRRVVACRPSRHMDIGSDNMLANLLAAVVPVTFVDYRALAVGMPGLVRASGDILHLPFLDASIESLSCLHVVEHVGLGRYGDALNPEGTRQACAELQRVLAPGGNLFLALPVGRPRVCFNAHRVHAPRAMIEYLDRLKLAEFSGVLDSGRYTEGADLDQFRDNDYACGMYWFSRPLRDD